MKIDEQANTKYFVAVETKKHEKLNYLLEF